MIICQCTGVTDRTICGLISSGEVCNLRDLTRLTGAGRCCEPCRQELRGLLYRHGSTPHTPIEEREVTAPAAA